MEDRGELGLRMYRQGLELGRLGTVAIGSAGGSLARMLARCLGCGVALAGGEARFHDGSCAACGVWLGRYYALPATVFLRQRGGEILTWILDGEGQPFTPSGEGRLAPCTGNWDVLAGADCGWAGRRAGEVRRQDVVAVQGPPALKLMLERLGCDVLDRPRPGVPLLRSDPEGFRLTVEWKGDRFQPPGDDVLDAAMGWLTRSRAVPAFKNGLV